MRLVSIALSGYRQFRDLSTLEVPSGLIGICGANGVGKSKLIEAIGYCLYGPDKRVIPSGDKAIDLRSKAPGEQVPLRVEIVLEIGEQQFEIVRTTGLGTQIRLIGEKVPLASGLSPVTRQVEELLGLSPDAFHSTCVARQKEVALLQTLKTPLRRKVVNRLIGITAFEDALKEVDKECTDRNQKFEDAEGRANEAMATAEADVALQSIQIKGVAELKVASQRNLEAIGNEYSAKSDTVRQIKSEVDRLAQKEQEIRQLEDTVKEAIENRDSAKKHLINAVEAKQIVALAADILDQTQSTSANLDTETLLEQRLEYWNELNELESLMMEFEELARRDGTLKIEIESAEAKIASLRAEQAEYQERVTSFEAKAQAAEEEHKRYSRLLKKAKQLGNEGECDTCGQHYGTGLPHALQRYHELIEEASNAETTALKLRDEALRNKSRLSQEVLDQDCLRRSLSDESLKYNSIPYEQVEKRKAINRIKSLLSAMPEDLPPGQVMPDRAILEDLSYAAAARSCAERMTDRHTGVASGYEDAAETLARWESRLLHLESQKRSLHEDLLQIDSVNRRLAEAQAIEEEAKGSLDAGKAEHEIASANYVKVKTRLESAQVAVQNAQLQKKAAEHDRYQWRVAVQTKEILRSMLHEIIHEARPRLSQLLEGWGRSLLGSHFRRIELDEDYLIRADNGSGLHEISHFSGGEQTLLAVMLRVAIAIYCQEQAGFDSGFLVLDEVFGDQDEIHREQLVQFLQDISTHFHQILIVNHIEAVTDRLDNMIDVEEIGSKMSRASVRS